MTTEECCMHAKIELMRMSSIAASFSPPCKQDQSSQLVAWLTALFALIPTPMCRFLPRNKEQVHRHSLIIGSQGILQDLGVHRIHFTHFLLQAELQVILGLLQLPHLVMLHLQHHHYHHTTAAATQCNVWCASTAPGRVLATVVLTHPADQPCCVREVSPHVSISTLVFDCTDCTQPRLIFMLPDLPYISNRAFVLTSPECSTASEVCSYIPMHTAGNLHRSGVDCSTVWVAWSTKLTPHG